MFLPDLADPRILGVYIGIFLMVVIAPVFGGRPERWGVVVLMASLAVQITLYSFFDKPRFDEVDWVAVSEDIVIFAGFLAIMLNANRIWTIFAFAMSLLSLLSHFARFNTEMFGFSYAQFASVPTVISMILVLIGTGMHQLRLRRHGEDPDWVPFAKYREYRKVANKAGL